MKKITLFWLILMSNLISLKGDEKPTQPTLPVSCYDGELKQVKGDWYFYARCCATHKSGFISAQKWRENKKKCLFEHGPDWSTKAFEGSAEVPGKGPNGRLLYLKKGILSKVKVSNIDNKEVINDKGHLKISE